MSDYKESISYRRLGEEGRKRFDMLASLATRAFGAKILDCFVSEVIQQDGRTSYPNFVLLLDKGLSECHDPMSDIHYDLYPLQGQVCALDVQSKSYESESPTSESRLSVRVFFGAGMDWNLQLYAAGEGCGELTRVLEKWIMPNLATPGG